MTDEKLSYEQARTELLYGEIPEQVEVREADIRYLAAPWKGQKTGAFLDQRENRMRAGQLARGRTLDCFSYHGSFTMHLAAHCDEVTAIDSSYESASSTPTLLPPTPSRTPPSASRAVIPRSPRSSGP